VVDHPRASEKLWILGCCRLPRPHTNILNRATARLGRFPVSIAWGPRYRGESLHGSHGAEETGAGSNSGIRYARHTGAEPGLPG